MAEIIADMGRYVISGEPDVLVCLGLGSCIGVAIYDPGRKMGGMAHVMLPTSRDVARNDMNMHKFADIAIPDMVAELGRKGCRDLKVKIAGGAHMFSGMGSSEILDIGKRNHESVLSELSKLGLHIHVDETGGNIGRTIKLDLATGTLSVKSKEGVKLL